MLKYLGIIPARYASTRFPGKPLAEIDGKSMINRVYERAKKSDALDKVIVATDDKRISAHVKSFGGSVMMTSVHHQNGTSRCAEVLEILTKDKQYTNNFDVVINVQGDEPYIDPRQINEIAQLFSESETQIGTLVKRITRPDELFNPNIVKCVFDLNQKALYFSRQPVPCLRNVKPEDWPARGEFFKHIGMYGYRASILKKLTLLKDGKLELAEKLEQLRWLEYGYSIRVGITDYESIAVDVPEDLLKFNNNH